MVKAREQVDTKVSVVDPGFNLRAAGLFQRGRGGFKSTSVPLLILHTESSLNHYKSSGYYIDELIHLCWHKWNCKTM